MSKFEFDSVMTPGDEGYDETASFVTESVERFDYNGFVEAYNELPVNALPRFKFDGSKLSGFKKQMERRGLIVNVDFHTRVATLEEATEQNPNPDEYLFVRKLSDKKGELITPKRAGRKAKDASADGEKAGEKADAKADKKTPPKVGGKKK